MFNLLFQILGMLTASAYITDVWKQTLTTLMWSRVFIKISLWNFRGVGVKKVVWHPCQPSIYLPDYDVEWEKKENKQDEAPRSFVPVYGSENEEMFDETWVQYALVTESKKLWKSFKRLFGNGHDRFVFWNHGAASHQIFHYGEGMELPSRIDKNAHLVCCHPELLPMELRKQHLFPNGTGPVVVKFGKQGKTFVCVFLCKQK